MHYNIQIRKGGRAMNEKVLVADGEKQIADLLELSLRAEGFSVRS